MAAIRCFVIFQLVASHIHVHIVLISLSSQIDLQHINQKAGNAMVQIGIDLQEFYPSVEWDILGVPAEAHKKYYSCCPEPYPGKCLKWKRRKTKNIIKEKSHRRKEKKEVNFQVNPRLKRAF